MPLSDLSATDRIPEFDLRAVTQLSSFRGNLQQAAAELGELPNTGVGKVDLAALASSRVKSD